LGEWAGNRYAFRGVSPFLWGRGELPARRLLPGRRQENADDTQPCFPLESQQLLFDQDSRDEKSYADTKQLTGPASPRRSVCAPGRDVLLIVSQRPLVERRP
jgi:hypothetical protein